MLKTTWNNSGDHVQYVTFLSKIIMVSNYIIILTVVLVELQAVCTAWL